MNLMFLFDAILVFALVVCAWISLTSADLIKAVVMFIAFGFLVALAWVRLQAPDVALAEAAVGSGLTGALLLSAIYSMRRSAARTTQHSPVDASRGDNRESDSA